jgi:hypothetical protein
MLRMTMSLTTFGARCHCFINGDALKASTNAAWAAPCFAVLAAARPEARAAAR